MSFRRIGVIAAIAIGGALLAFVLRRDDTTQPLSAPGVIEPQATIPAATIDDRPVFPPGTEFVTIPNPGGEEPHTFREAEPEFPVMIMPIEEAQRRAAVAAGSPAAVEAMGSTSTAGQNLAIGTGVFGATNSSPGGPGGADPGLPPEYGAPQTEGLEEDMRGTDIVVQSPEASDPGVPGLGPEASDPGVDYPAPEDSDPGMDYPAPEESGS